LWQRARQELLKSPTAVARAHPRPQRDRAGLAPLVVAPLVVVAEAGVEEAGVEDSAPMAAEDSAPMAAEGLVEDVGAVSAGHDVNVPAKAGPNSSALTGKRRN
jgi:hypothetical protein